MKKLACNNAITKPINNLEYYAKKSNTIVNYKIARYLKLNRHTTSSTLNKLLLKFIVNFSNKQEPGAPTPALIKKALQYNLLAPITNPSSDLLTYKGINLGSAINMKLSVQLASLLKDKDL